MQKTSSLYKELLADPLHYTETRVSIGDTGRLITKSGNFITFGGTRILIATTGADAGYNESILSEVNVSAALFSADEPTVGSCVSREVSVRMLKPTGVIEGLSRIGLYTRLTDGERHSEWLPQGVYFIDEMSQSGDDPVWLDIHGFDALLFAEQEYPAKSSLSWPARDIDVVREIAATIGVTLDSRTVELMDAGYTVEYPTEYSCREVLGYIAAMYGGCFVMSERGELRLVCFWSLPRETSYLIDNAGNAITFGGVKIRV